MSKAKSEGKEPPASKGSSNPSTPPWLRLATRIALWALGIGAAGALALGMVLATSLAVAYPNLPDISDLSDYRPKLPMRIFSAEGTLIGEFGEERRKLTPIDQIPAVMKNAVLAIEDARFYSHGGVDYLGVIRAGLTNVGRGGKSQGASTITMQVARNVYLSAEKTYIRKIYEILLTFKLEHLLTKDQILEIYMNQIFLGQRAYGFAAAAEVYFGKALKDVTVAEAAMLAGLPKAPSLYNPISNPSRARSRQLYIIERMEENGFITHEQGKAAREEKLTIRGKGDNNANTHAEYIAEIVRQMMYSQYGDEAYTRGLNITTTVRYGEQNVAYRALRRGIMDFERRQIYRGPEKFVDLPDDSKAAEDAIDDALADYTDDDDLMVAMVLAASPQRVVAQRQNGERIEISGEGLRPAQSGLSAKAPPNIRIRRGAIIRVAPAGKGWDITQLPEVAGAFVALDPRDGSVRALVGGFDFHTNKFNHVTQAWRQPGSSFKPFIYSAALEKGFTPATVVNDAPLFFDAGTTGGQPWEPKNYDGTFDGPMSLRRGLAKSKNMISIRLLQSIGPRYAQDWITHFGFDPDKHPAYLTMALGAGSVTPMQMASAYSVFANGGYRVNPYLVTRVTDYRGKVLTETKPPVLDESARVIDARNAFIMTSLLGEVTRSGTAARAQATLKRPDVYGKTGTTNDSIDAWFAGYQATVAAVSWIGYDNPRKLGDRETGGGLSLPVWISYMQQVLKGVPVSEPVPPAGVVNVGGEWFYDEYASNAGVSTLGMDDPVPGSAPPPTQEEKKSILDFFRN